jgi:hypothetical protein
VNDELESIWKEEIMAYFKLYLSSHFPRETVKTYKTCRDIFLFMYLLSSSYIKEPCPHNTRMSGYPSSRTKMGTRTTQIQSTSVNNLPATFEDFVN